MPSLEPGVAGFICSSADAFADHIRLNPAHSKKRGANTDRNSKNMTAKQETNTGILRTS